MDGRYADGTRSGRVTALYIALRFRSEPFARLTNFVIRASGDTDTIGAMAGSLWGAARGMSQLPQGPLERLEQRERIKNLALALAERAFFSRSLPLKLGHHSHSVW